MLFPVPAGVPPHDTVNHSAVAPVPALPPSTVRVVLPPAQMVVTPVAPVGATEEVLNPTLVAAVAVHPPVPVTVTV